MAIAALALLRAGEPFVMQATLPHAFFNRRGMRTGATIHRRQAVVMAELVEVAHFALPVGRVVADPPRRRGHVDGALGAVHQGLEHLAVEVDPFRIDFVGVFVDRHIHSPVQLHEAHVSLHLGIMLGLGFPDSLGPHFVV